MIPLQDQVAQIRDWRGNVSQQLVAFEVRLRAVELAVDELRLSLGKLQARVGVMAAVGAFVASALAQWLITR